MSVAYLSSIGTGGPFGPPVYVAPAEVPPFGEFTLAVARVGSYSGSLTPSTKQLASWCADLGCKYRQPRLQCIGSCFGRWSSSAWPPAEEARSGRPSYWPT